MSQIQDDGRDEYEMEATRAPTRASGKVVTALAAAFGVIFGLVAQDFNTGVVAGIWVVLIYYAPHPDYNLWHGIVVVSFSALMFLLLRALGAENRESIAATLIAGSIVTAIDSMIIRTRR